MDGLHMSRAHSEVSTSGSAVPGISGLAWAGVDTFLAVHDAKYPAEASAPRVSLVTLQTPSDGEWGWKPFAVDWPVAEGPSSDLESVAQVPGTAFFLLVESGGGRKPVRHVYLAQRNGSALHIRSATAWPVPIVNVEASAVARLGDTLVFVYAERSTGQDSTVIAWSTLSRDALRNSTLQWGSFHQASIPNLAPVGTGARAASDLAIDAAGRLFVTAAYDPDADDGPFQSSVWMIGRLARAPSSALAIRFAPSPCRRATLDGLKAEGLAVRPNADADSLPAPHTTLFVGTDDEGFGAVFRPLPATPCGL
jgi:hypothetical protein